MSATDMLDAESIVKALNDEGVEYVIIGAFAALAQSAPIAPTYDIDFTPSVTPDNLVRLSKALRVLSARIRVADPPEGVPFDPSPELLSKMKMLNLTCQFGDFDLAMFPSGFDNGFDGLIGNAVSVVIGDTESLVADLSDIVHSKRMAGRAKDRKVLPQLESFIVSLDREK